MMRLVVTAGLAALLVGCGGMNSVQTAPERRPPRVNVEKWFVITVRPAPNGGCTIEAFPDKDEGYGEVQVRRNWRVAWFVLNTCPAAQGLTPSLEFEYLAGGDTRQPKSPLQWRTTTPTLLQGRVRARGNAASCKVDPDAPCGRYKYTIHVGKDSLDPEWEIVMY